MTRLTPRPPHVAQPRSRREFLASAGGGFGALALAGMLSEQAAAAPATTAPSAAKPPHFAPTADRVIFLFMEGGPSHLDTFDRKPLLNKLAGQAMPDSFGTVITPMGESRSPLLISKRKWSRYGESGLEISDWVPHTATHADEIAVIRSCMADGINHSAGVCQMNSGAIVGGRPSLGAWVSYGLGTENANLPAFVVMQDNPALPVNGPRNWSAGFMPASYQGIPIKGDGDPIPYLTPPKGVTDEDQRRKLDLLARLNASFAEEHATRSELDARLASFELAYRMQSEAPDVVDLSGETEETLNLYGINQEKTAKMGRVCLLARRMAERGVRFIQIYHGSGCKWDAHKGIEKNHSELFAQSDQPVAALLTDLKRRGLLERTLVIWGGEFGRTPMSEQGDGRDHNPYGFTMWMAGGGVKGGQVIGATDDLGLRAVEDKLHVHDLHASVLHLLGLDNMKLMYLHKGRPERPTLNEGEFCKKLVTG